MRQKRLFCCSGMDGRRSLHLLACALGILPTVAGVDDGSPGDAPVDDPIASMEAGLDLTFTVGSTWHVVPRKASSDFHAAGAARPVVCDDGEHRCFLPNSPADLCPIVYSEKALTSSRNSACSHRLLSTHACYYKDSDKPSCYLSDHNKLVPAWRLVRLFPSECYRVVYERKRGSLPAYASIPDELLRFDGYPDLECGEGGGLVGRAGGRWVEPNVVTRNSPRANLHVITSPGQRDRCPAR